MPSKMRRRALAVPFVLVIGALPACVVQDEGPHANPPPPPQPTTTATVAPPPTTTAAPPPTATTAAPPPTATASGTGRGLVPTTPPIVKIRRAPDGSCWQDEETKCPPAPATCNPPPPRKVDCPK